MTCEEIRRLLHENGLSSIADDLLGLAAPTVRIYLRQTDEPSIPIGASKMGGTPDLPPGVEWPAWHEPMAFIGQFNLAEVAEHDQDGALPSHGLLSFFYETDGEPLYAERWGLPEDAPYRDDYGVDAWQSWRVLYSEGEPSTFVRHPTPDALNDQARYQACAVRLAAECTLPSSDGPEIRPLALTEAESSTLFDLEVAMNRGTWEEGGHHLLGLPYNLEGSALAHCDEASRGIRAGWEHAGAEGRLAIERAAADRWQLLLQVSGSDQTHMDWAGGGVLYFFVEREALRRQDFSRVWVTMDFL